MDRLDLSRLIFPTCQPQLFRARDVGHVGRYELTTQAQFELLRRHGRGLYSRVDSFISDTEALLWRSPHAIGSLSTAMWLHQVLADEPKPVWIAISRDARKPRLKPLRLETLRWSTPPAPADVVTIKYSGHGPKVKVFTLAKTAVDLIRARNRIGVDFAYWAVDVLVDGHVSKEQLLECGTRCGITTGLRRYLATKPRWVRTNTVPTAPPGSPATP